MALATVFETTEPSRAEIDALQEATVVEFGAPWCGHRNAAQPLIATAFTNYPGIRHVKIEDGPGRALGRESGPST